MVITGNKRNYSSYSVPEFLRIFLELKGCVLFKYVVSQDDDGFMILQQHGNLWNCMKTSLFQL